MQIRSDLGVADVAARLPEFWAFSGRKIRRIEQRYDPAAGAPVFTRARRYTSRGWTEWTQGFQFGSALLQFDATGDEEFLELGRARTVERMAPHLTHFGVHDHGFNNISTYGNLRRLMLEGRIPRNEWELRFYELALRVSGAVQARRWTALPEGGGFIHSFNGPHSLFADTIRSLRSLAVAYRLGQDLAGENDRRVSLLDRLVQHAHATTEYAVYYGEGRDAYDVRGRVAHESVFNVHDGAYRCPNAQQGYSPFSTWTRGLAWILLGFAEELEFLETVPEAELRPHGGRRAVRRKWRRAATAAADFYIAHTPRDGIPYWDTGAPGLSKLGNYLERPADPFNEHEPVDSSAAAIAAQGLMRLGRCLGAAGGETRTTGCELQTTNDNLQPPTFRFQTSSSRLQNRALDTGRGAPGSGLGIHAPRPGARDARLGTLYFQAGLTVLHTLLGQPYLSADPRHEGLILHSVYHRPNGWDFIPRGRRVPCGESSMWGDYHAREAAVYMQRIAEGKPYLTFWGDRSPAS